MKNLLFFALLITNALYAQNIAMFHAHNVTPTGPTPCDGGITQITDARDGKTYNVIKIGTQCWMAQNLNVGTMKLSTDGEQTNNGIIDKYCNEDNSANCTTYGGLYQWAEVVQYANGATLLAHPSPAIPANFQGICPSGWHIPSSAEWCTMENFIEPGTDPGCNTSGLRGTNTGAKLKTTTGWTTNNGTNTTSFAALPAGYLGEDNITFSPPGDYTYFWITNVSGPTDASEARWLFYPNTSIGYNPYNKIHGFSLRCIKDVHVCGDPLTDSRDGKTYNTVQIGSQCWMAENLNVGTRISGFSNQSNNATREKYCYDNNEANCTTYGGLYQWAEAVQYTNGATNAASPSPAFSAPLQGICPSGWHLPTDTEWCTMENTVESGTDASCNITGYRGTNTGAMLKTTTGWTTNNGTNTSNFSALPSGIRLSDGSFLGQEVYTYFRSSSESSVNNDWIRYLGASDLQSYRANSTKLYGYSIRCVKD